MLHEGVDLGERRVGERLGVLAHRPIEDREEGELVLVDVDAHRLGRLERGAGAQAPCSARQAFLADVDRSVGSPVMHISEMGLKRGLHREIVGGRSSLASVRCCVSAPRRRRRQRQEREREQDGGRLRGGAAAKAATRAQHQHGENVEGEESQAPRDRARAQAPAACVMRVAAHVRAAPSTALSGLSTVLAVMTLKARAAPDGAVIAGRMLGARPAVSIWSASDGRARSRRRAQLAVAVERLDRRQARLRR